MLFSQTEPYQNDSYDSPGDSASDISRSLHRLFGVYIGGIVLSALTVLMILGLAREQIALNGARKGRSSRLPVFGLPLLWEQLLLVAWWAGWLGGNLNNGVRGDLTLTIARSLSLGRLFHPQ